MAEGGIRYFSMFSGIGGFELGIQRAFDNRQETNNERGSAETLSNGMSNAERKYVERPVSCVGYSEIDKYATKVYERWFDHENRGNATEINPREIPDFDLLVGGFPCQAFSVAGKRGGFDDTRGTLFFEIARILKEKRPGHFLLENVKGLLSHDKGKTYHTMLGVLSDLGYRVEWQVLNSKHFGVPQNRERIFIIGHLRGECGREVLPIREGAEQIIGKDRFFRVNRVNRKKGEYDVSASNQSSTLTKTMHKGIDSSGRTGVIEQINDPVHSNNRVYSDEGVSPTLNAMQGGNRQPFIMAQRRRKGEQVLEKQEGDNTNSITSVAKDNYVVNVKEATNKGYDTAEEGDSIDYKLPGSKTRRGRVGKKVANTVDTDAKQATLQDAKIRRLTPKECERLQGFPDNWTALGVDEEGEDEKISDTQRYKMCGNAVTVNVIAAIIHEMKECLS